MADKKQKSVKGDSAQTLIRVKEVTDAYLDGRVTAEIVEKLIETYDYSRTGAYKLCRVAQTQIKKMIEQDIQFNKSIAVRRLDNLLKKNMAIQDYREARQIVTEIAKINGVYTNKIELSGKIDSNTTLPPIQINLQSNAVKGNPPTVGDVGEASEAN